MTVLTCSVARSLVVTSLVNSSQKAEIICYTSAFFLRHIRLAEGKPRILIICKHLVRMPANCLHRNLSLALLLKTQLYVPFCITSCLGDSQTRFSPTC